MAIFNSYVKLPEGNWRRNPYCHSIVRPCRFLATRPRFPEICRSDSHFGMVPFINKQQAMGYTSSQIWNIYGIYMEYIWNIYGIYDGYKPSGNLLHSYWTWHIEIVDLYTVLQDGDFPLRNTLPEGNYVELVERRTVWRTWAVRAQKFIRSLAPCSVHWSPF